MSVYTLLLTCGLISAAVTQNLWETIHSEEERNFLAEEARLDMKHLAGKDDYYLEEHIVTTKDGYILTIHRLGFKQIYKDTLKRMRSAVFLMHGLMDSSDSWVLLGKQHAFAYLLLELGFDVWMGNSRGNKYGRKHKSLSLWSSEFWDFSFEHVGLYDLPAIIDFVLAKSEKKDLYYIGHSLGTTSAYVLLSMKPEYNEKIKIIFSLSPQAWMGSVESPLIRMFSPALSFFTSVMELTKKHTSATEFFKRESALVCRVSPRYCQHILSAMVGPRHKINPILLPIILGHMPTGSSTLSFLHYGQLVRSKKFCRFDYGVGKNIHMYARRAPPGYDLNKVTVPTILYYSDQDWLANPFDVNLLKNELPNSLAKVYVPDFNSLDFVYSNEAREAVFEPIMQSILAMEENPDDKEAACPNPNHPTNIIERGRSLLCDQCLKNIKKYKPKKNGNKDNNKNQDENNQNQGGDSSKHKDVDLNQSGDNSNQSSEDVDKDVNSSNDVDRDPNASYNIDQDPNASNNADRDPNASYNIDQDPNANNDVDKDVNGSGDIDRDGNNLDSGGSNNQNGGSNDQADNSINQYDNSTIQAEDDIPWPYPKPPCSQCGHCINPDLQQFIAPRSTAGYYETQSEERQYNYVSNNYVANKYVPSNNVPGKYVVNKLCECGKNQTESGTKISLYEPKKPDTYIEKELSDPNKLEDYVIDKRKLKMAEWSRPNKWFPLDPEFTARRKKSLSIDNMPSWFNLDDILDRYEFVGDAINVYKNVDDIPYIKEPASKIVEKLGVPPNYLKGFYNTHQTDEEALKALTDNPISEKQDDFTRRINIKRHHTIPPKR